MNHQRILFRAAMIAEGADVVAAPGAVLVEGERIIAAGSPQSVGEPASDWRVVDLPDEVIIPPLVNAHTHLDLSHIGPQPAPPNGDFTVWVEDLRSRRRLDPEGIDRAVKLGVEMARRGGTAIIGDIAGITSLQPIQSLRQTGMAGVSFLEVFGLARHQHLAIERMRMAKECCAAWGSGVALGMQPHAPYSCGVEVYHAAVDMGLPLATHLAETLDEIRFVQTASGPLADMLRRLGVWDDSIKGHDRHPIDHLAAVLRHRPFIAAHLNYIDEAHLHALKDWPITVAYCPRASQYFGHPKDGLPPHRYREMLEMGVNVALGTDSIICLDTPDRLSVLDDMRLLYQRDGVDSLTLLRMATINGAKGLGFDPQLVGLSPGPVAGLLAVPITEKNETNPLQSIVMNDLPPRWLVGPFSPNDSWRRKRN